MPLIRPFRGLRPYAKYAPEVLAPPYDVLNTAEAREQAKGRPLSFLHISKPEIDLPEGTDPYDLKVYQTGALNLQHLIKEQVLFREAKECYYLYRLTMAEHVQTGLVAIASVPAYVENTIKKHEFTRPQKEDDRVRQIDELNAQTGPVFLTYRHNSEFDILVSKWTEKTPEYDVTAGDGIRHEFWPVDEEKVISQINIIFAQTEVLYIADGHHRSAAAARVAEKRNSGNEQANHNYFLSVIFPDNQMKILDYNRVIKDLQGMSKDDFIAALSKSFEVKASNAPYKPTKTGEFGMYLDKSWYRLNIRPENIPQNDPVRQLDVSLLAEYLIEPILKISDPRRDDRIDFVGGIRGLEGLEKRVDSGEMAVAFSLYPTKLSQLMAVADANEVMPPKSTWFEPKLADGLVSHVLD